MMKQTKSAERAPGVGRAIEELESACASTMDRADNHCEAIGQLWERLDGLLPNQRRERAEIKIAIKLAAESLPQVLFEADEAKVQLQEARAAAANRKSA
jgi:hypothetical protein